MKFEATGIGDGCIMRNTMQAKIAERLSVAW